jgi:hypothetical protein
MLVPPSGMQDTCNWRKVTLGRCEEATSLRKDHESSRIGGFGRLWMRMRYALMAAMVTAAPLIAALRSASLPEFNPPLLPRGFHQDSLGPSSALIMRRSSRTICGLTSILAALLISHIGSGSKKELFSGHGDFRAARTLDCGGTFEARQNSSPRQKRTRNRSTFCRIPSVLESKTFRKVVLRSTTRSTFISYFQHYHS